MKFKLIEGNALSRLYTHLNKDDNTDFAIIGSLDKDDISISHYKQLFDEVHILANKYLKSDNKKENAIGIKYLTGTYTMGKSGDIVIEKSILIYRCKKEDALMIAKAINQESIIWKDKDFFGFIYLDGREENCFDRNSFDFSSTSLERFASQLTSKHIEGNTKFSFKLEETIMPSSWGLTRIKEKPTTKIIFEYNR